ncbi:MAG: hypothetical protein ACYDCM_04280 [Candidatus Acidiferrales bacterium]
MTYERKIIVGLEEIKAVIFQCNECKSRIVLAPENVESPPRKCPREHAWDWNIVAEYDQMGSPFVCFLLGLKQLRNPLIERCGFKVFLEFEEPKASS